MKTLPFKNLFLLFVLLCLVSVESLVALDQSNPRILVLNSYHQGFKWTDEVVSGITDSLNEEWGTGADFFVEYMDTKRNILNSVYSELLYNLYRMRYQDLQPDLILTTDNNAFLFLLTHQERLFSQIPVVFCGVNDYRESSLLDHSIITGIVEQGPHFADSVDLIQRIQPEVRNILVLTDYSETGTSNYSVVLDELSLLGCSLNVKFLFLNDYYFEDIIELVSTLPDDTVLYILDFFRDKSGQYFDSKSAIPVLCEAASVPVYTHNDTYMENGPLGGIMNQGYLHGRLAGQMASRILHGESVISIPIVNPSPTQLVLDYNVLEQFEIELDDVPEDTVFLNKPFSFYEQYIDLIWIVILIFFILVLLLVFLISYLFIKRKSNRQLRESEGQFRSVFEGVSEAIIIFNPNNGIITDLNQVSCEMFEVQKEDLIGRDFYTLKGSSFQENKGSKQLLPSLDKGSIIIKEWLFIRSSGEEFWTELIMSKIFVEEHDFILATVRDITEKKQSIEVITKSLKEKEVLLKEVHHRVKNNFQIVLSLLSFQEDKNVSSQDLLLQEVKNRIKTMALVHDFLYCSKDLAHINFTEYVHELASFVTRAYHVNPSSIQLVFDTDSVLLLNIQQAIPCGLIVNELLTNSIKYAFPEGWESQEEIKITLRRKENTVLMGISDNGIGLDVKNPEHKEGMGLTLVKLLSEQLDGVLGTDSSKGTSVLIHFPYIENL